MIVKRASGSSTPITLANVGAAPNDKGAVVAGSEITLEPADATHPGVVTAGTQTIGGAKTLALGPTLTTGIVTSSVADGASAVAFTATSASLTTAGAKLWSWKNSATEKLSVDKDGKLAGTFATPQKIDLSYGANGIGFYTGSVAGGDIAFLDSGGALWGLLQFDGFHLRLARALFYPYTDSSGTPGAATINKASGRSAVAALASSVVITSSVCTTTSIVLLSPEDIDTTLVQWKVVPASGSFTVTGNATATADWKFRWAIIKGE